MTVPIAVKRFIQSMCKQLKHYNVEIVSSKLHQAGLDRRCTTGEVAHYLSHGGFSRPVGRTFQMLEGGPAYRMDYEYVPFKKREMKKQETREG